MFQKLVINKILDTNKRCYFAAVAVFMNSGDVTPIET